jgi:hypothetical protein
LSGTKKQPGFNKWAADCGQFFQLKIAFNLHPSRKRSGAQLIEIKGEETSRIFS